MDTKQKIELKDKIGERIDFLTDHWIQKDNKAPFNFGGWREEIISELVEMFSQLEQEAYSEGYKKGKNNL